MIKYKRSISCKICGALKEYYLHQNTIADLEDNSEILLHYLCENCYKKANQFIKKEVE